MRLLNDRHTNVTTTSISPRIAPPDPHLDTADALRLAHARACQEDGGGGSAPPLPVSLRQTDDRENL